MGFKLGDTKTFTTSSSEPDAAGIIREVYQALKAKGYDPITQLVGYILSGDPTYITSYNQARSQVCKVERDELMEELVRSYIQTHLPNA